MSNRFPGWARSLALLLVACGALGGIGLLWRDSVQRSDVNFLPRMAPAEWIVYPCPPQGAPHSRMELGTVFRCGFVLKEATGMGGLRVAGFHRYRVTINGQRLEPPVKRGRNWKEPDVFDVGKRLVAGQNEIQVSVSNTNGPPALWLALDTGAEALTSGEQWEASLAGATWRNAELAIRPKPVIVGSQLYWGNSAWDCLRASWPMLLVFTVLSAFGYWLATKVQKSALGTRKEILVVLGMVVFWEAVFANNLGVLPETYGFDVHGHMEYVNYVMEHKSLPLANQGFEMFQPPLYYVLCAALLKLLRLTVAQPGGVMALRVFGMVIGMAHILIVWASLRLLFGEERSKTGWGVVLAGCLPPVLYLSHYVTNEAFAAALASGCVCLTLYLLKQARASWKLCAALGLCLGAALLAKVTAVLTLPPILGALVWRAVQGAPLSSSSSSSSSAANVESQDSPWRWLVGLAVASTVCLLVCGWHYGRTWVRFGTPVLGNWDPRTGFSYWQDDGYRTSANFFRFGEVLLHPWFSGMSSIGDGLYSTLWGDGLLSGTGGVSFRPPWNYELMTIGYWLALMPTMAVLAGVTLALRRFLREPSAEWFLLMGLGFLATLALVKGCLVWPAYGTAKAFYALPALVPFCAFGAWGLDVLERRSGRLRPVILSLFSVWALTSLGSFWISHSSASSWVARARSFHRQDQYAQAAIALEKGLEAEPQSLETRSLLAGTLIKLGQQKEAVEQATIVLTSKPQDVLARLVLSEAFAEEKQIGEATEQAWKAVEAAPGEGEAYQRLATLLLQQRRFEEAERASRAGLGIDAFNAELRLTLGAALLARNAGSEANCQLELACQLKPEFIPATNHLSEAFRPAALPARIAEAGNHHLTQSE